MKRSIFKLGGLALSVAGSLVGLLFTAWMSDLLRAFLPSATLPIEAPVLDEDGLRALLAG